MKWALGVLLVLACVVLYIMPLLANTEAGRQRVAQVLGRAFGREVTLGGLNVGFLYATVKVEELAIANPEGYPPGPMLTASHLKLDSSFRHLLTGVVQGGLAGEGVHLHILRRGGGTNLDGLIGGGSKDGGEPPDLDLSMELEGSRLTVEDLDTGEKLVLAGVGLVMRLTNRAGVRDAGLRIHVDEIERAGVTLRDLEIDARHAGDWLKLEKLAARLPGRGTLSGAGRLRVQGGDEWKVKLDARNVGIEEDMLPLVGAVYPLAADARGEIGGELHAEFDVSGHGLTWSTIRPTLAGSGRVSLTELTLPQASVLARIAHLAGREEGAVGLNNAGAQFQIQEGWLEFQRLSASGEQVRYDLDGRVSLAGELRLTMDLMPLVKRFGGGDTYRKVARYVDRLPMRIEGTTVQPQLKAPRAEDLLKDVLEKKLGKELEELFKKR
ncbi:MAG: AsmA family protein [Planctomycetota bacterium]